MMALGNESLWGLISLLLGEQKSGTVTARYETVTEGSENTHKIVSWHITENECVCYLSITISLLTDEGMFLIYK